jgi:uncharacterized protein (DUF433 family)
MRENAMATAIDSGDIGKLISRSSDIWHGLPVITGTRITVMGIVSLHLLDGMTAQDIARDKNLTLAQVYAALAYYYANRQQMDKEIALEQAEYDKRAKENGRAGAEA